MALTNPRQKEQAEKQKEQEDKTKMGTPGRPGSLTLPLLVGFLLAAVIALAIAVYLLSQPLTTESDRVSGQQEAAPQASDGEEGKE